VRQLSPPQDERTSGDRAAWNFDAITMFPPATPALPGVLQTKLAIGAVNDPLEHEADRVADQVMRMPEPMPLSAAPAQISRKCDACEEEDEEKLQKKSAAPAQISRKCDACEEEDEEKLQKKSAGPAGPAAAPPIVHEVLRAPGEPLDAATRAFMEPRFGYDFSHVRVHADHRAAASASAVSARAYTLGSHIAFAPGCYNPTSESGKSLLAHELAHVVQQNRPQQRDAGIKRKIRRQSDVRQDRDMSLLAFEGDEEEDPYSSRFERGALRLTAIAPATVQRSAVFQPGDVHADLNEASQLGTAGAAGFNHPVLNGTMIISEETAVASLKGPEIGGRSTTEGVGCFISSVPTNICSLEEHVPTNGPWTADLPKATLSARFGLAWGQFCGPTPTTGNANLTVRGRPSDADFAKEIKVHEDHHGADHERLFNAIVGKWDKSLTAAQSSGQTFTGTDETSCEAALFSAVGGRPEEIASRLQAEWDAAGNAFHATPEGKKVDHELVSADDHCDNLVVEIFH
jgi:hypothetical protein